MDADGGADDNTPRKLVASNLPVNGLVMKLGIVGGKVVGVGIESY